MERAVSLSVIQPFVEVLPGVHILPWQLELLREEAEVGPQLTDRASHYMGLMSHVALYGSEGSTEIQEEGLEDRIDAFHEWIRKWLYPPQGVY